MPIPQSDAPRIRGLLRTVRHGPDRILHPRRQARAAEQIRTLGLPVEILFVCHGNICRSPYAQFSFLRRAPLALRATKVRSAGFVGPGRASPPKALRVASARGVDMTSHRSRLITVEIVRRSGLIVVMDGEQRQAVIDGYGRAPRSVLLLGDLDPEDISTRGIRDPWGQDLDVFERVFERVDRCVATLVHLLAPRLEAAVADA